MMLHMRLCQTSKTHFCKETKNKITLTLMYLKTDKIAIYLFCYFQNVIFMFVLMFVLLLKYVVPDNSFCRDFFVYNADDELNHIQVKL